MDEEHRQRRERERQEHLEWERLKPEREKLQREREEAERLETQRQLKQKEIEAQRRLKQQEMEEEKQAEEARDQDRSFQNSLSHLSFPLLKHEFHKREREIDHIRQDMKIEEREHLEYTRRQDDMGRDYGMGSGLHYREMREWKGQIKAIENEMRLIEGLMKGSSNSREVQTGDF